MERLDAEQVKSRTDIVTLVESYGAKLKPAGEDGFVTLCPFHNDQNNPSLSVSRKKQLFNCFACGAKGDAIEFVKRREGVNFPDALTKLAEFAGIPVITSQANGVARTNGNHSVSPAGEATASPAPAAEAVRIVTKYRYTDEQGTLLYEVLRLEPKSFRQRRPDSDSRDGWTWKLGDVRRVLYRLPEVVAADEVWLVEGEKDADNLAALGFTATTNAGGASQKWLPGWTEALAGKRVVVTPDSDTPGLKRANAIAGALRGQAAEVLVVRIPSPYKDVSDFIEDGHTKCDIDELANEARRQQRLESLNVKGLLAPREIVETIDGGLGEFMKPSPGISTGFPKYDRLTLGLHPGELTIIAARPAMGKTSLAMNIADHVAGSLTVAVFSLEMSRRSLLARLLCGRADVNMLRFREGVLDQAERRRISRALNKVTQRRLFIDDSHLDLTGIEKRLRRLRDEQGLGLVVVDYLQLLGSRRSQNRNLEIGELTRGFKLLAGELRCPFLLLSQLSRATETRIANPRPQLSDLRDSGEIENHADVVVFIFREEVYKPDKQELRGKAELIISKQRNGPTGTCALRFHGPTMRFTDAREGSAC